jgi:hypothetical protein
MPQLKVIASESEVNGQKYTVNVLPWKCLTRVLSV